MKNVRTSRVPSVPRLTAALKRRGLSDAQIEGFVTAAQSTKRQSRLTGELILAAAKGRRLGDQAEAILSEACGETTRRTDGAEGSNQGGGAGTGDQGSEGASGESGAAEEPVPGAETTNDLPPVAEPEPEPGPADAATA